MGAGVVTPAPLGDAVRCARLSVNANGAAVLPCGRRLDAAGACDRHGPQDPPPAPVDWAAYCACHEDGRDHVIGKLETALVVTRKALEFRTRQRDVALAALDVGDTAALLVAERARQLADEGWTPEHDDRHAAGQLARAAAVYATPPGRRSAEWVAWLWPAGWRFKPSPAWDRTRELVKAGALILAEIERLHRAGQTEGPPPVTRE